MFYIVIPIWINGTYIEKIGYHQSFSVILEIYIMHLIAINIIA